MSSPENIKSKSETASPLFKKFIDDSSIHSIQALEPQKLRTLSMVTEEVRNPEIYKLNGPFDLHEMLKDESEDEEEQINYELDSHLT